MFGLEAERALRKAALARNNWYGVHSDWGGELVAMMMTFTQTATKHGLNAMAYLHYVLDRFAQYEEPRDLCELFPWNIPKETRHEYGMTYKGCDPL